MHNLLSAGENRAKGDKLFREMWVTPLFALLIPPSGRIVLPLLPNLHFGNLDIWQYRRD
ncbi:MAG: hypothetical protein KBG33_08170 [Paludibacteraceae bacterium]|nr:hypothetical protein [Paludibacteraceae bacterium]